jgi:pyochelin synthetase
MTVTPEMLSKLSPEEKRRLLADLLKTQPSAAVAPRAIDGDPDAPFQLNDMQQAFWLGRSAAAELGNIGCHGYVEIESHDLDVGRAQRAFRQLVQRHDLLRAIILPDGTQRVLREVPEYEIAFEDLSQVSEQERGAKLLATREALSHQVFDVEHWPLFDIRAKQLDAHTTLLCFSIDLIIADTQSIVTLFREWSEFYAQPQRVVPQPGYSFRQYCLSQPALSATEPYARAEAYWTQRIPVLPDAPQLPLRVDPSTIVEPHFVRHADVLEPALWSALKVRGQELGITPSALVCTVYVEILERWSQRSHFTLNVIPSVRLPLHPDVHQVVGPFSSINLLEVDLRESQTFVDKARALQTRLYDDLDHMQYNGVRVLRKLAQRDGSGLSALMPIVFTSTMLNLRILEGFGRIRYMLTQTPQVWIDHQLAERDGALLFNWDVVEALFPEGMMAEMFAAFSARLRDLASDQAAFTRREFDALPPSGLLARQLVNASAAPLRELTLHEAVWEQARRFPTREAIVSEERRMTYGELALEARALSGELRRRGARPGQLVAVSFPKGFRQVVAMLGILDAGAAYLPLEPTLPKARRELLLQRANCQLIVSAAEHVSDLGPEAQERLVSLGTDHARAAVSGAAPTCSHAQPGDLAYVIFTSGSTGVPKGVMISHRAALNTLDDINQRHAVTAEDRVLALSSIGFDLSVYDVFGVLSAGGCLVIPKPGSERDPAHWVELIERERVTLWNSVPALMRLLVEHAHGRPLLAPLRLVLLSGDWIPVNLPDAIRRIGETARVVSLGGATEASVWSIEHPIDRVEPEWRSIPYGKPLRNQQFHVRDSALRDCPTWVAGELYIAGAGLALGYLDDPERTAQSFVRDPKTGERLYRTGDLGRYLPDGSIEFLGRRDAQVKISGHRIELEEIDANLVRHPDVRAALVRAVGDRHDKRLVAYVELADAAVGGDEESLRGLLRRDLAERLPDYMVPRQFVFLERFPLTENGKIDVARLPAPELNAGKASVAASRASSAERDKLERIVLEVWEEVLQHAAIDPHANFFDLGGDSLRMVRVRRLLSERLGRDIPLVELYTRANPLLLAEYLAEGSSSASMQGSSAEAAPSLQRRAASRAARRRRARVAPGGGQ